MWFWCCSTVFDVDPTSKQHWVNVSCLLGIQPRFVVSSNNAGQAWNHEKITRHLYACAVNCQVWRAQIVCRPHAVTGSLSWCWPTGCPINILLDAHYSHWAHDVVATLKQRHWHWFNVATTSCAQWVLMPRRCCECAQSVLMSRRCCDLCPVSFDATTLLRLVSSQFRCHDVVETCVPGVSFDATTLLRCVPCEFWCHDFVATFTHEFWCQGNSGNCGSNSPVALYQIWSNYFWERSNWDKIALAISDV